MKLAALAFLCMMVEGSVADWSAVYLRTVLTGEASIAAIGYSAFAFSMAACRIIGDVSVRRLGPSTVVALGGFVAASGLALVLGFPSAFTAFTSSAPAPPIAAAISIAAHASHTSPRAIANTRALSARDHRPAASAIFRAALFALFRACPR